MAQFFQIHPQNPQLRLIARTVEIVKQGGIIALPTDSSYALACQIGDKKALDGIRRLRKLDDKHNFTLICKDLSQISNFAKIGNDSYRLIKSLTPGPFTFILKATREVPRRLQHPKRKTVGIRVPDNAITQAIIENIQEPLFSTTLILPGDTASIVDPSEIRDRIEHEVDLIIDGGSLGYEPTTIILLTEKMPEIVRQGKGVTTALKTLQ